MASKEFLDCSSTNIGANSWFDLSKSDYAKVIFSDLYYNPDSSVGCRFQITDNVHEDPCDYVGLFKVGYENLSQCLVSKMLSDTECEEDGKLLRCTFKSHELPKLENGFYQFLYVTRDNEVCGASMPFEIKQTSTKEASSEDEDIVADKTEDDFLVVRSNIAEQNRNLQDLINKMNEKTLNQETFYSSCISKLSKEQIQLQKDLKRVREERDQLSEECRKILEEKNAICKASEETVQNLEEQITGLASKIEVAYDKFRGLEKVKDAIEKDKSQALMEKAEMKKICETLMMDLDSKIVSVNSLQQELKQKKEYDLKKTEDIETSSLLASQLEDAKLMIAALEESKLLVMNEVTQLTASNAELRENLKNLRCENLALKLKLRDAESVNAKIVRKNHNLKSEVAALKLHFVDTEHLQASNFKVGNTATKVFKMKKFHGPNFKNKEKEILQMDGNEVGAESAKSQSDKLRSELVGASIISKILNVGSIEVEEESLKSQCDKLQSELVEKESIIAKLKEDCLKKDAVVEYLSNDRAKVLSLNTVLQDALDDSVLRLQEAAEIYKKQYLKIEKLKKKVEKTKSKERHSSESSSVREDPHPTVDHVFLASEHLGEILEQNTKVLQNPKPLKNTMPLQNSTPLQNRSSDSDTGEHVLGHATEVKKYTTFKDALACKRQLQRLLSSNRMAHDKAIPKSSRISFKDLFGQSLDLSYLGVASTSNDRHDTPSKQSPELGNPQSSQSPELGNPQSSQSQELGNPQSSQSPELGNPQSSQSPELGNPQSRQSPELQSMIDQNLAKLTLSLSKDEEEGDTLYSIPCPVCDADIGIFTSSSEEMIKHLEVQHKQQLCPVCGKLFDMTLPQKYFQFHVEDHFFNGNGK